MCLENLSSDMQVAIVSGSIGLFGAVIGAIATLAATWLTKRMQMAGKVSLYAKIVYSKSPVCPACGCYPSGTSNGLFLRVPLWLDIVNTCGVSRIVRNVNLYAYSGKGEVASFTQIQRIGDGDSAISLGSNGAYTFVIPANSACRFDVEFMLKEAEISDSRKRFDKIILSYFDEKNRIHAFQLVCYDFCWTVGEIKTKKEWIILNKRCRYANYRKLL